MDTGTHITVSITAQQGQLLWYVLVKERGKRRYVAVRGVAEREPEPTWDTLGKAVMDAAYEAYRALGE